MYDIVNGASNYLKVSSDHTLLWEGKLQRFLCTLKNKDFFTKEQYDNMYLCGITTCQNKRYPKDAKVKVSHRYVYILSNSFLYRYSIYKYT